MNNLAYNLFSDFTYFYIFLYLLLQLFLFNAVNILGNRYRVRKIDLPSVILGKIDINFINISYVILVSIVFISASLSQTFWFLWVIFVYLLYVLIIFNILQIIYINIGIATWVADSAIAKKRNWRSFFWLTIFIGLLVPVIVALMKDDNQSKSIKTKIFKTNQELISYILKSIIISVYLIVLLLGSRFLANLQNNYWESRTQRIEQSELQKRNKEAEEKQKSVPVVTVPCEKIKEGGDTRFFAGCP